MKYLKENCGIEIRGYMAQLGPIKYENFDWDEVENNPFFFPDLYTTTCVRSGHPRASSHRQIGSSIFAQ